MVEALMQSASECVDIIRALGGAGVALYAVIFFLATIAFVPASPLTAIAGFLYGPLWGTLLISLAGLASALVTFIIGRTIARPWVGRRLVNHPRLAKIDTAVARGGLRIVFLLRLASIVPFAPLSYVFGASRVSLRDFVFASWLGLLPGTFLYVYLGSLVSSVSQIISGDAADNAPRVFAWVGLVIAALALLTIANYARKSASQLIERV